MKRPIISEEPIEGETLLNKAIRARALTNQQIMQLAGAWEGLYDINDGNYEVQNQQHYCEVQRQVNDLLSTLSEQDAATLKCVLVDDLVGEIYNAPHLDSKTAWMTGDTILHAVVDATGNVVMDITEHIHTASWQPAREG